MDNIFSSAAATPPSSGVSSGLISEAFRENELGKHLLSLAITIVLGIVLYTAANGSSKLEEMLKGVGCFVVMLMVGVMSILNGILFRRMYDRAADLLEHIGAGLVLISIYGLVAISPLVSELGSVIVWIFSVLCLFPILTSVLLPFLN